MNVGWPRCGLLVAVAMMAAVFPVSAQERPEVRIGERVRVHAGGQKLVGILERVEPLSFSISLSDRPEPWEVDVNTVDRIEVYRGQKRAVVKGAVVGTAAFGVLSMLAILDLGAQESDDPLTARDVRIVLGAGIVGGLVLGALPGALIGALFKVDDWEDARVPGVGGM